MNALRIRTAGATRAGQTDNPVKNYLERLVKLIPAEVVGLYLAGKSLVQSTYGADPLPTGDPNLAAQTAYMLGWTLFCLVAIVVLRAWATADPNRAKGPQWAAVAIATVSFLIWVYSFGDIFRFFGSIWSSLGAGLLVLAWTFIVPLIYHGDDDTGARADAGTGEPTSTGRAWTPPESPRMRIETIAVGAGATLRIAAEVSDGVKRFAVSVDDRPVRWTNERSGTVTVAGVCGDQARHRLNYTLVGAVGATLTLTVFCGAEEVLKLEDIEVFPEGEPLAVGWGRFQK